MHLFGLNSKKCQPFGFFVTPFNYSPGYPAQKFAGYPANSVFGATLAMSGGWWHVLHIVVQRNDTTNNASILYWSRTNG